MAGIRKLGEGVFTVRRLILATQLLLFLLMPVPHCIALQGSPSDEITLDVNSGFPNYRQTLTLKSDETFTYTEYLGDREPKYRGKINGFYQLIKFIEAVGFFKMKDNYISEYEDAGVVTVTVVRGGKQKRVEAYGGAVPLELWGIEKAIWGMVPPYEWIKAKEKGPSKE